MATPTQHSSLSASGAGKWLNNPPSLWMEEGLPNPSSPYAEEGTDAHRLVELKLKLATKQITKRQYTIQVNKLKAKSEYYGQAMEDYAQQHVDLVLEDLADMPDGELYSETRVDFGKWAPGGYGTADTILVNDDTLSIWDYKYGKGVRVRADHNVQLMLYALGAVDKLGLLYDFTTVKMTINQPRIDNLASFTMSLDDLLTWGKDVVMPAADKALNGEGPWDYSNPSSTAFYRAMGFDRHLAEKNLEIRKYKFREANTLSDDEIADILDQAPLIKRWLTAVEDYATDQVLNYNKVIPGYKVVEGRSNRVITDKDKAASILEAAGIKDIFRPQELKTLSALERLLGKKEFNTLLGELVEKPQGKPTMVPEEDHRQPYAKESAQDDFDEYTDDTDKGEN